MALEQYAFEQSEQLFECISLLIDNGSDINFKIGDRTLVMWAAHFDCIAIVRLLVDKGADLTVKDNDQKTALDLAKSPAIKNVIRKKTASCCLC